MLQAPFFVSGHTKNPSAGTRPAQGPQGPFLCLFHQNPHPCPPFHFQFPDLACNHWSPDLRQICGLCRVIMSRCRVINLCRCFPVYPCPVPSIPVLSCPVIFLSCQSFYCLQVISLQGHYASTLFINIKAKCCADVGQCPVNTRLLLIMAGQAEAISSASTGAFASWYVCSHGP